MNQRERYINCLTLQKVDRIPNMELGVWPETIERWHGEGMAWWVTDLFQLSDHFGMDKSFNCDWMHVNNCVWPEQVFHPVEDGGEWEILEDGIGTRMRKGKKNASIPQFLRFPVSDAASYERLAPNLDPATPERYAPDYDPDVSGRTLRGEVRGVNFHGLFGFARDLMGLEDYCIALYDDPELVERIMDGRVDMAKRLYKRAFQNRDIDFVQMWEDMAYKTAPLISPDFIEGHMIERYREITDTFRAGGVRVIMMDCDGNLDKIVPLLKRAGIDGIYPCEIAAGSDPLKLRRLVPDLPLQGGVDKRALGAHGREGVKNELRRLQPLIREGAFIPMVDHFIPPDISYDTICYYMELKREVLDNPGMKI
jgi:uroporphyrinogen decarboxylase